MFELKKLTGRLIALGVMLSCLVFAVTASFTGEASAASIEFCRSCENTGVHEYTYCSWYVVSSCATDPPLKSTLSCYTSTLSCDVGDRK